MAATSVVESRRATQLQADRALDCLYLTDNLMSIGTIAPSCLVHGHEVNQFYDCISGKISGEQDICVRQIELLEPDLLQLRFDAEGPASLRVQESCEDCGRIKMREAEEIDGAVESDGRG